MKFRHGFVSNSSSSSFIIAFKSANAEPCPTCKRGYPDLLSMVERTESYYEDNSVLARGKEEVLDTIEGRIEDWGDFESNKESIKELKKIKKDISELSKDKEWEFAEVSISNHDLVARALLHENDHVKILFHDGY